MNFIKNTLHEFDASMSSNIQKMKSSWIMDYTLWFPAQAFGVYGYPFLMMMVMYLYPVVEKELKNIEDLNEL